VNVPIITPETKALLARSLELDLLGQDREPRRLRHEARPGRQSHGAALRRRQPLPLEHVEHRPRAARRPRTADAQQPQNSVGANNRPVSEMVYVAPVASGSRTRSSTRAGMSRRLPVQTSLRPRTSSTDAPRRRVRRDAAAGRVGHRSRHRRTRLVHVRLAGTVEPLRDGERNPADLRHDDVEPRHRSGGSRTAGTCPTEATSPASST
jgi:hypothetical protein